MKKLEDKTNLTRLDYFIYYKELKAESENTDRLLDENKLYLEKLENIIQEKNYEIKQLEKDYDETNKLLALKIKDIDKMTKQISKLSNALEKVQKTANRQQKVIEKLNISLVNKDEELRITNERLNYCKSHRRSPDIEELKAYTYREDEVTKRIRGKNVSE